MLGDAAGDTAAGRTVGTAGMVGAVVTGAVVGAAGGVGALVGPPPHDDRRSAAMLHDTATAPGATRGR